MIESAELPTSPVGPNKLVSVALAAAIGFVLAAGAAYLLEYLDNTIRTPEEITQALQVPVLGAIANREESEFHSSYIAKHPRSIMAEAFRSLRTNIEFAGVDKPLRSILVTSAGVSEGKTAVAVNLAVIMAQGGKKVIILDADLRKPNVHNYLELSNNRGLSDVFRGSLDLHDAIRTWEEENIICITAGNTPPNPAELIGSNKMDNILERLEQLVDVIVIDAPPLIVTDAAVLASKVDGVLMVVRYGHTPKDRIQAAMELIHRSGARVIGVALNRIPRNGRNYYSHYQYSGGYYGIEETPSESTVTPKSGDSYS
ncbi:MAG TPA: polysaccharide biosynthesis tyrosine autokinase [bacterium]|nr:polysaccharide biosynthesis tyrosine autokinase [bacterium]